MMIDSLVAYSDTLIYNPKLSGLNPIFIPDPVVFEPVTLGWYILLGLFGLILLFFLYKILKKYQSNAYRRIYAKSLKELKPAIGKTGSIEMLQNISTILKLTAYISFSREKVARITGSEWEEFLKTTYPPARKINDTFKLLAGQYQTDLKINAREIEKLIDVSINWVRRHRV